MTETKPQIHASSMFTTPWYRQLIAPSLRPRSQDGFALIVVIWAIGLIALLFVTYVAAARYRLIEASRLTEHARAQSAAMAAINIAILDLLSAQSDASPSSPRFRQDGSSVHCALPGGMQVAISVTDEGGKIDLNSADPALIEALARGLGLSGGADGQMAAEILRLREAAAKAQRAQGIAQPNTLTFRTVLELDQIPGMTTNLFRAVVPLTTIHSGKTGIDPRVAPAALLKALVPGGSVSRAEARTRLPPSFVVESPGTAFLISSEVVTGTGVRVSRDALVELTPASRTGYHIHEWREGSLHIMNGTHPSLPPC